MAIRHIRIWMKYFWSFNFNSCFSSWCWVVRVRVRGLSQYLYTNINSSVFRIEWKPKLVVLNSQSNINHCQERVNIYYVFGNYYLYSMELCFAFAYYVREFVILYELFCFLRTMHNPINTSKYDLKNLIWENYNKYMYRNDVRENEFSIIFDFEISYCWLCFLNCLYQISSFIILFITITCYHFMMFHISSLCISILCSV